MNQQYILPPKHQDIVPDEDDVFDGDIYLDTFKAPILTIDEYEADQPTFVEKLYRDEEKMEDIVFQIENVKLTGDLEVRQRKATILKRNISQMLIEMKQTQQNQKRKAQHQKIQKPALRQELQKQQKKAAQLQLVKDRIVNVAMKNFYRKNLQFVELQMEVEIVDRLLIIGKTKLNRQKKWLEKITDKFNNIGYQVEDAGIIETKLRCQYNLKNILLERQNQCEERQKQIDEMDEIIVQQKSKIDQVGKSLNQSYEKYVERLKYKENLTKQILDYRNKIVTEQNSVPTKKITVGYDWYGNSLVLVLIFLVMLFKQYY